MHMVWHDDIIAELIPGSIEVEHGVLNDLRMTGLSEQAGAVPGIQKLVESFSEPTKISPAIPLAELSENIVEISSGGRQPGEKP